MEKNTLTNQNNNDAVAGIVVAVMIVGLLLAVVSIVQITYVPRWMESRESEHMATVAQQFSKLKYAFDIQSIIRQPLPMMTSVTLGSKELGFLTSSKAQGQILLQEDSTVITVKRVGIQNSFIQRCGILEYSSENSYYLDQTYIYELGAVILKQDQGMVITTYPSITVDYIGPPSPLVYINFSIVNLSLIGGKNSLSGFVSYPIRTEYNNTTVYPPLDPVEKITLTTQNPTVWYNFFIDSLNELDMDGTVPDECSIDDTIPNQITINFPNIYAIVNLQVTTINVQLAPGWIE